MLHKVFNENEERQWSSTETKKIVCRVQGGRENGPSISGMSAPNGMIHAL